MSKGALLFAFNSKIDYFKMAVSTAKRINHFLNIPVSVVTDVPNIADNYEYKFDNVIYGYGDRSNSKEQKLWINKGRGNAYDLSPYDETLLLDTDYLVNSNNLLTVFDYYDEVCFHNTAKFLMNNKATPEMLGPTSMETFWATVILFKKTERVAQLFDCIKMVQNNYLHYVTLHGCYSTQYRNDFALTIAARIMNGHIDNVSEFIPWPLLHVTKDVKIEKASDNEYNTNFLSFKEKEYMIVKDIDIHMLDKDNFMRIV